MDKIHLPVINLTPTMRCNLKCKLCGVMVAQYSYRPHITAEEFAAMLKAVFEIVDGVDKLQITGGEPLLHTDLPEMLEECLRYSTQFDVLQLFTNCAVPFRPELVDVLQKHKDRIVLHLSDYGIKPELVEELLPMLERYGISHRYLKYYGDEQYMGGWVDQGDFVKHGRSDTELNKVFAACSHVVRGGSWYVRGGQMHWCGRSIRGTEVGKIPLLQGDYLDIFNGTINERRGKLQELRNAKYITACDYCNGLYGTEDDDLRQPAGEQI